MKQTAIEYLIEKICTYEVGQLLVNKLLREEVAEAKEIGKQQIVDAHTAGMIIALKTGDDEDFRLSFNECAEQYYQNTFKK